MEIDIYQVDAFAAQIFEGNPAAVCPLTEWLPDETMQQIAMENNLSETAFLVEESEGYALRWFTPAAEVDLCGHATLATAHVLFEHLYYSKQEISFVTHSGILKVRKNIDGLTMNFPATHGDKVESPTKLLEALGVQSNDVYKADDYMVVVDNEQQVQDLNPNFFLLSEIETRGIIVTAPGNEVDFVSRFFAPLVGINEDPVTGSAHTMMAPYWSEQLGKNELNARQLSKRGGDVNCKIAGDRVEISGKAKTYLTGQIEI